MLKKLLRLISVRGAARNTELASELGVSPVLVREMLENLAYQGYLETVVPGCTKPCKRCPLCATCHFRQQSQIWVLTRKGRRSLGGTV
jgi:predicted ArsR family transcriptional regulator